MQSSKLHQRLEATVPFRKYPHFIYLRFSSSYFARCTVASEATNYFETKSTLDFAATAKKCVVTRMRGKAVADRFCRSATIEAQLQLEIDSLRHRVDMLREEVELGRERSRMLQKESETTTTTTNHGAVERLKEHIGGLELQCSAADDPTGEKMKGSLITRRLQVDDYQ